MRETLTPEEAAEERQLWADYYEATRTALELVCAGGITAVTLPLIVAADAKAATAIKRIKEIRKIGD